ncbi:MAG TPA: M56 family metallopeptidase, partial [Sphingomicrobium sp.]
MIDWLTGTFLATSLLMAFVLLVREPVRRQFGPSAAYGLWLIPALRLMLPPMVTTVERTATAAQPITKLDALQPVADPGL